MKLLRDYTAFLHLPGLRMLLQTSGLSGDPQLDVTNLSFRSSLRHRTTQHQDCGRRGSSWGSLAMAGQSAHKRQAFLRGHPDQQPVGPDGSSLFPGVSSDPFPWLVPAVAACRGQRLLLKVMRRIKMTETKRIHPTHACCPTTGVVSWWDEQECSTFNKLCLFPQNQHI